VDVAVLEEEVGKAEVAEFGDAQSAGIEDFDDGMVAHSLVATLINNLLDAVYLLQTKHIGQILTPIGTGKEFRGVVFYLLLQQQETVERTHSCQHAGDALGRDTALVELGDELVELGEGDLTEVDGLLNVIVEQFLQVAQVCIEGVGREGFLEPEILRVAAQDGLRDSGGVGNVCLHDSKLQFN
jgi:hypothetical protein